MSHTFWQVVSRASEDLQPLGDEWSITAWDCKFTYVSPGLWEESEDFRFGNDGVIYYYG